MKNKFFKFFLCSVFAGGIILNIPKNETKIAEAEVYNSFYNIIKNGSSFVNGVEIKYELREVNNLTNPRISAYVSWVDSGGTRHGLKNNKITLKTPISWIKFDYVTNEFGEAYHVCSGNYGVPVCWELKPDNNAAFVNGYACQTEWECLSNNQWLSYEIIIHSEESELANAFELTQAALLSQNYVKSMSGDMLNQIEIKYPDNEYLWGNTNEPTSYYCDNVIHITTDSANRHLWDVMGHEYGHYIDDCYNISPLKGGHEWGKDLIIARGGLEGAMGATLCEGLATYFGQAAQDYFPEYHSIPLVGDMKPYDDVPYSKYDPDEYSTPYMDESSIARLLIKLMDDTREDGDNIQLGHKGLWNILMTQGSSNPERKHDSIKTILTIFLNQNEDKQEDLNKLLEFVHFSSFFFEKGNLNIGFDFNGKLKLEWRTELCDHFTWINRFVFSGINNDSYVIEIEGKNGVSSYYFNDYEVFSYELDDDEFGNVMSLSGETITCRIHTTSKEYEEGMYIISSSKIIEKPKIDQLKTNSPINYAGYVQNNAKWLSFVADGASTYKFSIKSFNRNVQCKIYRRQNGSGSYYSSSLNMNQNSNGTWEGSAYLYRNEKILLEIEVNFGFDQYQISADEVHICSYSDHYETINPFKHKAYCSCGNYTLEPHTFVTIKRYGYNNFEVCKYCGETVEISSGNPKPWITLIDPKDPITPIIPTKPIIGIY